MADGTSVSAKLRVYGTVRFVPATFVYHCAKLLGVDRFLRFELETPPSAYMCPLLSHVQAALFVHEQGGRSNVMLLVAPSPPAVQLSVVLTHEAGAAASSQLQPANGA